MFVNIFVSRNAKKCLAIALLTMAPNTVESTFMKSTSANTGKAAGQWHGLMTDNDGIIHRKDNFDDILSEHKRKKIETYKIISKACTNKDLIPDEYKKDINKDSDEEMLYCDNKVIPPLPQTRHISKYVNINLDDRELTKKRCCCAQEKTGAENCKGSFKTRQREDNKTQFRKTSRVLYEQRAPQKYVPRIV